MGFGRSFGGDALKRGANMKIWTMEKADMDSVWNIWESNSSVVAMPPMPVGVIYGEGNAQLVSAVPDLLRAAEKALCLLRGSGFTDNTLAIIALKAAIYKAVQ